MIPLIFLLTALATVAALRVRAQLRTCQRDRSRVYSLLGIALEFLVPLGLTLGFYIILAAWATGTAESDTSTLGSLRSLQAALEFLSRLASSLKPAFWPSIAILLALLVLGIVELRRSVKPELSSRLTRLFSRYSKLLGAVQCGLVLLSSFTLLHSPLVAHTGVVEVQIARAEEELVALARRMHEEFTHEIERATFNAVMSRAPVEVQQLLERQTTLAERQAKLVRSVSAIERECGARSKLSDEITKTREKTSKSLKETLPEASQDRELAVDSRLFGEKTLRLGRRSRNALLKELETRNERPSPQDKILIALEPGAELAAEVAKRLVDPRNLPTLSALSEQYPLVGAFLDVFQDCLIDVGKSLLKERLVVPALSRVAIKAVGSWAETRKALESEAALLVRDSVDVEGKWRAHLQGHPEKLPNLAARLGKEERRLDRAQSDLGEARDKELKAIRARLANVMGQLKIRAEALPSGFFSRGKLRSTPFSGRFDASSRDAPLVDDWNIDREIYGRSEQQLNQIKRALAAAGVTSSVPNHVFQDEYAREDVQAQIARILLALESSPSLATLDTAQKMLVALKSNATSATSFDYLQSLASSRLSIPGIEKVELAVVNGVERAAALSSKETVQRLARLTETRPLERAIDREMQRQARVDAYRKSEARYEIHKATSRGGRARK